MPGSSTAHELAVTLIDEHGLNASLQDVEPRVWSLTSRNVPPKRIRGIILDEFGGERGDPLRGLTFTAGDDAHIIDLDQWR